LPYHRGGVDQVDQDPGDVLGQNADVGRDPVVSARCSPEDGVAGPGGAPGAVGQREDHGQGYALLDADHGHDQQGSGRESELEAVEAQDGPQLTGPEELGGDEYEHECQHRLRQVSERRGGRQHDGQDNGRGDGIGELPSRARPARGEINQPGWAAAGSGPAGAGAGAGSAVPRARPDSRFAAAAWKRVMSP
jgi:hypothetical protein